MRFLRFALISGALNPQNTACCVGKTDSCLKLPFLKQIEQIMISGSMLALRLASVAKFSFTFSVSIVALISDALVSTCS